MRLSAMGCRAFVSELFRRRGDVFGTANVVAVLLLGHSWTVPKGLEALEESSRALWMLWLFLLLFFVSHWAAVVGYGPGRPPAGKGPELPRALKSLLAAGQSLPRPLSSEESWCRFCEEEKPALASHCQQCNRCCFWMDHHCNFLGQCVGFRNLRCFIMALTYGSCMCLFLAIMTLKLWSKSSSILESMALAAWSCYLIWLWRKLWHFLLLALWEVVTGWRSAVMRMKFSQWQELACDLGAEIRPVRPYDRPLQQAFSAVLLLPEMPTHPLGIFLDPDAKRLSRGQQFEAVFGSKPSFAWLLPFPGGTGDPNEAHGISTKACELWQQLAMAVSGEI